MYIILDATIDFFIHPTIDRDGSKVKHGSIVMISDDLKHSTKFKKKMCKNVTHFLHLL